MARTAVPLTLTVLLQDRLLDTALAHRRRAGRARRGPEPPAGRCAAAGGRRLRGRGRRYRAVPSAAGLDARQGAARVLAAALFTSREAQDAAAGESWSADPPLDSVLSLERGGHQKLALLTR